MIKVTPELGDDAKLLVKIYDETPGSAGPYCNPDGLAAVLEAIAAAAATSALSERLLTLAKSLRGGS